MAIRVLIVDDSRFICKRITEILEEEPDFEIVGIAANGKQAVQMNAQLKPDMITMDVEMPIMDGISAVKQIVAEYPTAILMFSAATHAGAQATLDALSAGAIDFLPKQLDEIDTDREMAKRLLRYRVRMVALQSKRIKVTHTKPIPTSSPVKQSGTAHSLNKKIELLVIVASTGGPVAIQNVLSKLSSNCGFPTLIVQHMPHNFTESFAKRLNQLCQVNVKEASDNDVLKPSGVLLAPGGMQMQVRLMSGEKVVKITKKQTGEIYSPCADITLSSIANLYSGNVLTVILTGMGSDGKKGAIALKQKGFPIWAQDEASSTIYGMPKAIVDANLADKVYSLDDIANAFKKLR